MRGVYDVYDVFCLGVVATCRMNALLASGEVPGLYEGKELTALMAGCREAAQRDGVLVDSEDELFRRFTTKVGAALYTRRSCSFLYNQLERDGRSA